MPSFSLEDYHEQQLPINVTAAGATVVIPAIANASIAVAKMVLAASAGTNLTFLDGSVALSGPLQNVSTLAFDYQGALLTSKGNAFSISQSGTSTIAGWVSFYYIIDSPT